MVFDIGRLCVKTAGRDAAQYAVVVELVDEKYVLIDGNVRRKKCNIMHLEPTAKTLDVKKGADTKTVLAVFEKEGIVVKKAVETKPKKEKKAQVKKTNSKKTTKKSKKE